MNYLAKKLSETETLGSMLESLEAISFVDSSEEFEMLCSIASEVARIKRETYFYIEHDDGDFA